MVLHDIGQAMEVADQVVCDEGRAKGRVRRYPQTVITEALIEQVYAVEQAVPLPVRSAA